MSWQSIALTILGAWALYWLTVAAIDATRAAFKPANRTIALARAICADPIDAHFDTAVTEPEFRAETFADLRADWPAWEQEVRA